MTPKPLRQKVALRMLRQGRSTQEITAATGYIEFSIYRLAQEHGLEAHRTPAPPRRTASSVITVHRRKTKGFGYPVLHIQAPILRAAGLDQATQVHVTATPCRIVIELAENAESRRSGETEAACAH